VITLAELSKSFDRGRSYAVNEVSLEVADGETLILLGSSGSGKTTILKMINRLIEPSSGRVEVDGVDNARQDLLTLRRSIGYVFQDIGLFPHMTVAQNTQIVLRLLRRPADERRRRSDELLELVGLDPARYSDRAPSELSGGQQQRVGLARALAADPAYLLMDEPFGALDAVTRDQLQNEFLKLTRRLDKTVVFVTHDIFEALRLGDRIAVLHQGRLDQIGAPDELLHNPATDYVRDLFDHARRQAELLGGAAS